MLNIGYGRNTGTSGSLGYNNSMTVTGSGSTLTLYNSSLDEYKKLYLGFYGSSNKLIISSGGSVACESLYLGYGDGTNTSTGGSNIVTLTGKGKNDTTTKLAINGATYIGYYGSGNSLTVKSGADVTGAGSAIIGTLSTAHSNTVTVTGMGSTWVLSGNLTIGNGSGNYGNLLTIASGGLVKIGGSFTIYTTSEATSLNAVCLNYGILAINTDVTGTLSTLLSGKVMVWNGTEYVSADVSSLTYDYCADTAEVNSFLTSTGLTAYGYTASDLVGYTLITAVPEPATCALFGGLGALGLALYRRRCIRA